MNELDFNIGKSRTEFIAELVNGSTNAYIYARVKPQEKYIYRYYTYLKALHLELLPYVKEKNEDDVDTDTESIKDAFDSVEDIFTDNSYDPKGKTDLYDVENYENALEKLTEIQLTLSNLRKEIGLDIPASKDVDPEEAGIQGLN